MKFYKLFTFESIKITLLLFFLIKVLGVPSFFFFFYSFCVDRESIIDSLKYLVTASAGHSILGQDNIQDAYYYMFLLCGLWFFSIQMMETHLGDMSVVAVMAELLENQIIVQDTTIEECIELIKNQQFEKVKSYDYPWNKLYEFEMRNSSSVILRDIERVLYEIVEESKKK